MIRAAAELVGALAVLGVFAFGAQKLWYMFRKERRQLQREDNLDIGREDRDETQEQQQERGRSDR